MEITLLLDLLSLIAGIVFLYYAILIRRKVKLPQNDLLLLVGVISVINIGVHIPGYFPTLFPMLVYELGHPISDAALLTMSISLLWYGFTSYSYVKKLVKRPKLQSSAQA